MKNTISHNKLRNVGRSLFMSFQSGMEAFKVGDYQTAEDAFKSVLEQNENDHIAWNALGVVYTKSKEYKAADTCYENAINLSPGTSIYERNREKNRKKWQYDDLLIIDDEPIGPDVPTKAKPKPINSVQNKGLLISRQPFLGYAIGIFAILFLVMLFFSPLSGSNDKVEQPEINPNTKVAVPIEQEKPTNNINTANKAIEWLNKGIALENQKQYEDSVKAYEMAIQLNPELSDAYYRKAMILFSSLSDNRDALLALEKVNQISPENFKAWANKGNILCEMKRFEEALIAYDKAIQLDPKESDVWYNKGLVLFYDLSRDEEALVAFDKVTQLNPTDEAAWSMKSSILYNLGRIEESDKAYDQVKKLRSGNTGSTNGNSISPSSTTSITYTVSYPSEVINPTSQVTSPANVNTITPIQYQPTQSYEYQYKLQQEFERQQAQKEYQQKELQKEQRDKCQDGCRRIENQCENSCSQQYDWEYTDPQYNIPDAETKKRYCVETCKLNYDSCNLGCG